MIRRSDRHKRVVEQCSVGGGSVVSGLLERVRPRVACKAGARSRYSERGRHGFGLVRDPHRTKQPVGAFLRARAGSEAGAHRTVVWVFELPDGRRVEVFGLTYPGKWHFDSGPVVGFAVDDLSRAVDQLREAGVELLGEPGTSWQGFRGPDGNVYELVSN